jgi:hypothetical protein
MYRYGTDTNCIKRIGTFYALIMCILAAFFHSFQTWIRILIRNVDPFPGDQSNADHTDPNPNHLLKR